MSVYVSEFNKESWVTLTEDMDYSRFLNFYNNIMFYTDYKSAVQDDAEREANLEAHKEQLQSNVR